jgi:8-oxo-dGTP diphosphatase
MVEDTHFITIGFLYENPEEEPKVMEPDEITEWKWFALDNLPAPIFFPSAKVLKNYLVKKIY